VSFAIWIDRDHAIGDEALEFYARKGRSSGRDETSALRNAAMI
jgi:hypothetical protein